MTVRLVVRCGYFEDWVSIWVGLYSQKVMRLWDTGRGRVVGMRVSYLSFGRLFFRFFRRTTLLRTQDEINASAWDNHGRTTFHFTTLSLFCFFLSVLVTGARTNLSEKVAHERVVK